MTQTLRSGNSSRARVWSLAGINQRLLPLPTPPLYLHLLRCYYVCRTLPSSLPAVKTHSAFLVARLAIHTFFSAARNQTLISVLETNSWLAPAPSSRNSSCTEQPGQLAAEGVRFNLQERVRRIQVEMGCTEVSILTRQESLARVLSSSGNVHYDHKVSVQPSRLKSQLLCISYWLRVTLQPQESTTFYFY